MQVLKRSLITIGISILLLILASCNQKQYSELTGEVSEISGNEILIDVSNIINPKKDKEDLGYFLTVNVSESTEIFGDDGTLINIVDLKVDSLVKVTFNEKVEITKNNLKNRMTAKRVEVQ